MKNKKLFYAFGLLLVVVAAVAYVLWPDVATDIICGEAFGLLAVAPAAVPEQTVQGTVTTTLPSSKTDDFQHPEINRPTISQSLTKIMPSLYPLDTMLRELKSGSTNSDKYEYYSTVSRGVEAVLKTASESVAAPEVATLSLLSTHMLSKDGNLLVPKYEASSPNEAAVEVQTGVAKKPLVLHIVSLDMTAKTVKVIPLNASGVPAFAAGLKFYRMGTAKDQLAAISEDPQILPTKDFNYCQINMCTVSEGVYQAMQEKDINYGLNDLKENALMDFRYQNEVNAIFGSAREFIDPISQKAKYTMDGFVRKVNKILDKGTAASITSDIINGWCADIFDCNNGSDTRLMLYGADFANDMANSAVFEKQLEAGKTEIKFGLKWNQIETNFGTLLCRMHTGLGMNGYGKAALVIDPANIRRIEQRPLEATDLELDKTGVRRTKDVRLSESFTLEVTNPDTHAILFS